MDLWIDLMVGALSHEATGLNVAPAKGRFGPSPSVAHISTVSFLRTLASSVVRLGEKTPGCGPCPQQPNVWMSCESDQDTFEELPYVQGGRRFETSREAMLSPTQALAVVAERLSLPEKVQDFDPVPFLSPAFQRIYEHPDEFLKRPEGMPEPIRRAELLKVFARWDTLEKITFARSQLFLFRTDERFLLWQRTSQKEALKSA